VKIRYSVFALALLILISCSGSAPVIEEVKWRVLYRDDGTNRFEELSMFLRISDTDGTEDPAIITVSAGNTGLLWRFPAEEWISHSQDGAEWLGLPGMIPLYEFRLPDALYTLRLEDLAGRSSEVTFRPDPERPQLGDLEWPDAEIRDGTLVLQGPHESAYLILRDEELNPVDVISVTRGSEIGETEAIWWELWISLDEFSNGFRLGPYLLSISDTE
jgi:hypothetical protein